MAVRRPLSRILRAFGHDAPHELPAICPRFVINSTKRYFSTSATKWTDGVFQELTAQRLEKPWIEALREQQSAKGSQASQNSGARASAERDLTPKHMRDSYHSVVCEDPARYTSSLTDAKALDYSTCSGPVAVGYLCQRLRPHSTRYHLYGSRCPVRCCRVS